MSGLLREYEDLQWFLFRYTNLKALPYSEMGNHELGGAANRTLVHEGLRIKLTASVGNNSAKQGRVHAVFPRLYTRGNEQGARMHGPRELQKIPDSPLWRAYMYVNLIAALADLPQENTKLFLWLPETVKEYNQNRKYPVRNLRPEDCGTTFFQVDYNRKLMDAWLAYAQRHPDYCMGANWEFKLIDYAK